MVGYITRGSGISVHRSDCPNVQTTNPEELRRLIPVTWDVATDSLYKVGIVITSSDKPGIMADIMMAVSESKVNINNLNCHIDKRKIATIQMGLDISSLDQLDQIMKQIKRTKGVFSVERQTASSPREGGKR